MSIAIALLVTFAAGTVFGFLVARWKSSFLDLRVLVVTVVLLVAGVIAAFLFTSDTVLAFAIAAGMTAAGAAWYAAIIAGRALLKHQDAQRLANTMQVLHSLETVEFTALRRKFRNIEEQAISKLDNSDDENAAISILNRFEDVAIALECGALDEALCRRSLSGWVRVYYGGLFPVLDETTRSHYEALPKMAMRWAPKEQETAVTEPTAAE